MFSNSTFQSSIGINLKWTGSGGIYLEFHGKTEGAEVKTQSQLESKFKASLGSIRPWKKREGKKKKKQEAPYIPADG